MVSELPGAIGPSGMLKRTDSDDENIISELIGMTYPKIPCVSAYDWGEPAVSYR